MNVLHDKLIEFFQNNKEALKGVSVVLVSRVNSEAFDVSVQGDLYVHELVYGLELLKSRLVSEG